MDLSPPIRDGKVDQAYANPRDEVTVLIPPTAKRILDVGSSVGIMGQALRRRGCTVTGIEMSPVFATEATGRLDKLISADVEVLAANDEDPGGPFDCVVMADVLEHLRDPWSVTRWAAGLVAPGGSLVISVPNIRHLQLLWSVGFRRRWPYRDVGLFDRTHLRWFALRNLPELLDGTGFEIAELRRNFWLTASDSRINRLAPRLGDLGTLQFIFRAERAGGHEG
ncbi:MAG: class I SAM-dependent methyltransferase [Acidimicrobiales bacterium]